MRKPINLKVLIQEYVIDQLKVFFASAYFITIGLISLPIVLLRWIVYWIDYTLQITVWYKFHFTQYYQKFLSNPNNLAKIMSLLRRSKRHKLERQWTYRIIKRNRNQSQ